MPFEPRIRLPHTDLRVGRIGLGSSFGIGADDLALAYEHGINYFYWGSIRRPAFGQGIRDLARRHRDDMVVAVQSYARGSGLVLRASVEVALRRLGLDYADVLVLGWYNHRPARAITDAAQALRERGRVRYLMMSGHHRPFFAEMARDNVFDLFMVRYNAAHRGAEHDVFPKLPSDQRHPSICAYTATRWGTLVEPKRTPAGERTPTAGDCYRFCITNPEVDLVLCGPATTAHVREACRALDAGPMSDDELAWMRRVGDRVYGRSPIRSLTD